MTYNLDHYYALKASLYREQERLINASTLAEKAFRDAQVTSKQKEITGEIAFLKAHGVDVEATISKAFDDILLDELFS